MVAACSTVRPEDSRPGAAGLPWHTPDATRTVDRAHSPKCRGIAPNTPPDRKQVLDQALRRYCSRDTEALVRLAAFLKQG